MSALTYILPEAPPFPESRVQAAIDELAARITSVFPEASFRVAPGEEPGTVFLYATVDRDDPDLVLDLVIERMMELLVDEELPIYVIPLRTAERDDALRRDQADHRPTALLHAETSS